MAVVLRNTDSLIRYGDTGEHLKCFRRDRYRAVFMRILHSIVKNIEECLLRPFAVKSGVTAFRSVNYLYLLAVGFGIDLFYF